MIFRLGSIEGARELIAINRRFSLARDVENVALAAPGS
jgi:hypothetical protein